MAFNYNKVLVLGLGVTGKSVVKFLMSEKISFIVSDSKAIKDSFVDYLIEKGIKVFFNEQTEELLKEIDLIVKSPGIKYDINLIEKAIKKNIPVISDIELASMFINNKIICVTGSNGKTTTSTLIYEIIKNEYKNVRLLGNIGYPICDAINEIDENTVIVLEASSFQLLSTINFKPYISVILNLREAHIDYHNNIQNYHKAKIKCIQNQDENDYFVYNYDDVNIKKYINNKKVNIIKFSMIEKVSGAYLQNSELYYDEDKVCTIKDIILPGKHNIENILAAISTTKILGISNKSIKIVLRKFEGVDHRLQFIGDFNGVKVYNDSKATNITATNTALRSFNQPIVLIMGGLDRGQDFSKLGPLKNVKFIGCFGETSDIIIDSLKYKNIPYIVQDTLRDIVKEIKDYLREGDILLFSPGCASWDQYKNFEERGKEFTSSIRAYL